MRFGFVADKRTMQGLEAAAALLEGVPSARKRPLGAVLMEEGLISADQLEIALAEAGQTGKRVGQVLVDAGLLHPKKLALALAVQAGLRFVDLSEVEPDPTVTSLLPEQFARRYQALPIRFSDDDTVIVAVADPTDIMTADDLRLSLGLSIELVVVEADALALAITRAHRTTIETIQTGFEEVETAGVEDISDAGASSAPAIKLVNSILGLAIDDGASDIHIEPQKAHVVVRARIDGVMREITTIPRALQPAVSTRLKVMGDLDIAEKRLPQDGRVTIRYDGRPTDLRIAVMPTAYGEQIVLRIFQARTGKMGLADLGMSAAAQAMFERAITQPYGAVITCGPTGSGKTTTLYAALDVLNEPDRVLMTIEDPIEYQMEGVNQVEVNNKAGLSFGRGLRTILRSDPDVLLVGEVRDEETALIAVQAAMTGHLVLTTLHTNNAPSAIERLKNMGVEASLLASALNCIVAQRLARRLCLECREPYWPTSEEQAVLGLHDGHEIYGPRGCSHCSGTGYRGRVALYEVMPVDKSIRRLIDASTDDILAAALEQGMTTLRQDGLRLVAEGVSSLDEIRRITGDRML
jgi:type IV pilus assembly protein PilB